MVPTWACIQGVLKVKVKVKVHVIRTLLWFHENCFFSQANGWIATKLAHDGPHMGLHPGCAQGQGQRSRDTVTSLMSRNVCYTVRSQVLPLHALTLWNTNILSFQYKYQAARCLNIGMSYSVIDGLVLYFIRESVNSCRGLNRAGPLAMRRRTEKNLSFNITAMSCQQRYVANQLLQRFKAQNSLFFQKRHGTSTF